MNQTLEAMAQAIFKEWFVDFNFPGFHGEFVDGLPKGWKMGKLNDISSNFDNKRVPLSSMQRKDKQGIYPYYGAATIFDYIDEYIFDGTYLLRKINPLFGKSMASIGPWRLFNEVQFGRLNTLMQLLEFAPIEN